MTLFLDYNTTFEYLLHVADEDLMANCGINQLTRKICRSDAFWKAKLRLIGEDHRNYSYTNLKQLYYDLTSAGAYVVMSSNTVIGLFSNIDQAYQKFIELLNECTDNAIDLPLDQATEISNYDLADGYKLALLRVPNQTMVNITDHQYVLLSINADITPAGVTIASNLTSYRHIGMSLDSYLVYTVANGDDEVIALTIVKLTSSLDYDVLFDRLIGLAKLGLIGNVMSGGFFFILKTDLPNTGVTFYYARKSFFKTSNPYMVITKVNQHYQLILLPDNVTNSLAKRTGIDKFGKRQLNLITAYSAKDRLADIIRDGRTLSMEQLKDLV